MNSPRITQKQPKSLAKACLACRTKKVRCDGGQPRCSTCSAQHRECIYRAEKPRKRPTFSQIDELRQENESLTALILAIHQGTPSERDQLLSSAVQDNGEIRVPQNLAWSVSRGNEPRPVSRAQDVGVGGAVDSSDDEVDISHFISHDEAGKPRSFGPSSALHIPSKSDAGSVSPSNALSATQEHARNSLVANAALQRQHEASLRHLPSIEGVPTKLALQLLDSHWMRQHHTCLLTYRPAIMRDLPRSGPNYSSFLVNAIFAVTSKFSGLLEVRDDPGDSSSAGRCFFTRCDELLAQQSLLMRPTIPTIVGLLLLGSTYNARGETSKGWLYTGYALRMVYDMGLHLDPKETTDNPEEIEIRRRVFWGAFVCDKLQSLYLGRPVAINLRDSQVSNELLDSFEEREPFCPAGSTGGIGLPGIPIPIFSVSTFQQLCQLSKIMTTIINRFYVVGATFSNAQNSLQAVDKALWEWKEKLPSELDFEPWNAQPNDVHRLPPNVMILHCLYHTLIILVHRPFITDGHLRSAGTPARSWEQCTVASRRIIRIALAYKTAFGLVAGPYVLGYAIYVACTILVRNAASKRQSAHEDLSLLGASVQCLDELCVPNPGVAKPASIIRRLVEMNGLVLDADDTPQVDHSTPDFDLDAILDMFPVTGGIEGDFSSNRPGLESDPSYDPLFGLMDGVFTGLPGYMPPTE